MERPAYFGNLPPTRPRARSPPLSARPSSETDFFSHEVPEESNIFAVIASTDEAPLRHDVHGARRGTRGGSSMSTWGTKTYYLLQGNLTELECDSGECVEANTRRHPVHPHGRQEHKGYNFSEEKQVLFSSKLPAKMSARQERHILPGGENSLVQERERRVQPWRDGGEGRRAAQGVGATPAGRRPTHSLCEPGPESRKKPIHYYVQNKSNSLTTIFGSKFPVRPALPCQQRLPARRRAVPAVRRGRGISLLRGGFPRRGHCKCSSPAASITFFIPETEEVLPQAKKEEVMYIPEKVKYQLINYDDAPVEAYFAIGGGL